MQKKTIQKAIASKMEDWLKTINDESLRKDVRDNLLVSGGSIASMFMNEQVNDYDVYIKDKEVLKRLAQYYITIASLNAGKRGVLLDGAHRSTYVEDVEAAYSWILGEDEDIGDLNNQYAICIRTLKPDQIKMFAYNGCVKAFEKATEEEKSKYLPVFISPNAISLSNSVQIVMRFHGDNVAIHKSFDFVHATNYFTFEDGLVTNLAAVESILTKQLKYQGSLYPLTSIIRMKKFIKRGFNIGAGEMLKIMFQISELDLTDPDTLQEQLIGVDVAYFEKLINILRGIDDKGKITSEYLNAIIDKVFNESEHEE